MPHERFHLEDWLPLFPLQEQIGNYTGSHSTSPTHLCNCEHLRRGLRDEFDWGPSVPVDVFVMAEGEPLDRSTTKIAGLPYRPAYLPWPTSQSNQPLVFLAQFNFLDSLDIVGPLPGDVLLIFAEIDEVPEFDLDLSTIMPDFHERIAGLPEDVQEAMKNPKSPAHYIPTHMEWHRVGNTELVAPDNVPHPLGHVRPCYGHIFRGVSYPHAKLRSSAQEYPHLNGLEVWHWYPIPQYQGTQIGTAPFFIQEEAKRHPGRMICTLSSVGPHLFSRYPWINHPEPLYPEGQMPLLFDNGGNLMFGDSGCIYISLRDDGRIDWHESGY